MIRVTALLALSALACSTSAALAQAVFTGPSGVNTTSNEGQATSRQVPQCQAAPGGSRMRRRDNADCVPQEAATVRTEQELKVTLELPQQTAPQCEATTTTEYYQRNTVARVEGTISIANCPAGSAGDYTIAARVRDDSGETKVIEFSESWQLDGDEDVAFNTDYPIGENVELTNLRVRNLTCTCAEAARADAAAAAAEAVIEN
jgi:hypothetical protein